MKIIIFAGGTGKRLWPLSRIDLPKQFQPLFGEETSLENSYNLIKQRFSVNDIYISTSKDFVDYVFKTIPNLPGDNLIIEPFPRDTGPAVAYSMLKISQKYPQEPVVIRWQNCYITQLSIFVDTLDEAKQIFNNHEANLIYLAVPSKYPNISVGYIHLGKQVRELSKGQGLYEFVEFKEKPDMKTAQNYQKDPLFCWNPGCYITTPAYILNELKNKSPEFYSHINTIKDHLGKSDEWDILQKEYLLLEKKSIDYILWEKLNGPDIKVVLADYGWNYVATWDNLYNTLPKDDQQNLTKGLYISDNSNGNIIYNYEKEKLIALIDVCQMTVINTKDAILISPLNSSPKVKQLVEVLEKNNLKDYL